MATALSHRIVALFSVLLFACMLVGSTSDTAHAADGFKYWNYFHVKGGKYAFATTGPSGFKPPNGSVEAYRYGLSSSAAGLPPRAAATKYTVDDLCGDTKAKSGQKRVGVLIDYGTAADAADAANGATPPKPRGACAVVPAAASGQQVLDSVADIRVEKQLVCGIDGYPVSGCSVTVKNPPPPAGQSNVAFTIPPAAKSGDSPAAEAENGDGGIPWTLVGVVAAVVVIGGGALALTRRNRVA